MRLSYISGFMIVSFIIDKLTNPSIKINAALTSGFLKENLRMIRSQLFAKFIFDSIMTLFKSVGKIHRRFVIPQPVSSFLCLCFFKLSNQFLEIAHEFSPPFNGIKHILGILRYLYV